jgi:hypothetical protein
VPPSVVPRSPAPDWHTVIPEPRCGISIPKELKPQRLDVKSLGKGLDLRDVMRHIGNFAEQIEARSEDVRALSAQAKRLSRRIG